MQPIGVRNNNPLNIRVGKDKWKGQVNANGNGDKSSPSPRRGVRGEAVRGEAVRGEAAT